jgi:uncharacterized protein YegJ (DUF2314 family)
MLWIALLILATAAAGIAFWWRRRRRRHRLISFVALVRESVTFDLAVLAKVAGKVWKADLGDGTAEGEDGFVVGVGVTNTIMHKDRLFLINSFPAPYVPDVEKTAAGITDMRIRSLFCEHRAWFSCDAMGVDASTPEEEVRLLYRRLGLLFAELLDENCLLIYLPDSTQVFPINDDTEAALRSEDPLTKLQGTLTPPVIGVSDDDPLMKKAVAKARASWPQFVEGHEANLGEDFSVKAPVTHGDNTEFIWISVTSIEGERVYGELGNEPADLGPLKLGSKVSVPTAELNDWCYVDPNGNLVGGFTIEAVQKAVKRRRQKGGPDRK